MIGCASEDRCAFHGSSCLVAHGAFDPSDRLLLSRTRDPERPLALILDCDRLEDDVRGCLPRRNHDPPCLREMLRAVVHEDPVFPRWQFGREPSIYRLTSSLRCGLPAAAASSSFSRAMMRSSVASGK